MMKRAIALLLVICMLGITLVACGKKEDDPKKTQPTETETATNMWGEPDLGVDVPEKWRDVKFDGESIAILVLNDDKVSREWETADPGDDELDQQIALRNEIVEGNLDLNVEIMLTETCAPGGEWGVWQDAFIPSIQQDVDNKLHEIDLVANFGFAGMNHTLRDYYVNLHDKDTLPYFDFGLLCWNQALVENGTVNGRMYLIAGDMNLSLFNTAMIMWHNMDLYDKVKNVEDGDAEDIQDLVLAGLWTYDELYKWASYHDNAGDNVSCSDVYGIQFGGIWSPPQPNDAIPYAWDLTFFTKNSDGTYAFNFIGNEKAEQAMTNLRRLYYKEGNAENAFVSGKDTCNCGNHFYSGGVIFYSDTIYFNRNTSAALRDMEDRYALIPLPKYDAEQEHYQTTSQDYLTTVSVLDHSHCSIPTKGKEISAYLQYANEYSYDNVRGYYFHKIVKAKMFGTDDSDGHVTKSWTIFNEIVNNLKFDFGYIYSHMFNHILSTVWRTNVHKNPTTVQLKFEENQAF